MSDINALRRIARQAMLDRGFAPDFSPAALQPRLARHCTEREDDAGKVERQVRKSAAAMLLESQIGREFDAIVTGAADKGTWVRINHPVAEGKVVRNSQGLDVGDRVRVTLLRVDIERGFIDFAAVGSATANT